MGGGVSQSTAGATHEHNIKMYVICPDDTYTSWIRSTPLSSTHTCPHHITRYNHTRDTGVGSCTALWSSVITVCDHSIGG